LEVHVAEDVVQRYFVTYKGNQIEGRQRRGNVVLTPEDDGLKIYLRQGYLETERNWDELVEKLASFAGIDSRNNGCYLLQIVLTESRSRTAAKLLEFGVSTEVPDPEMMEEDESWLHSRREAMDMSRLRRRLAEMEGQASMSTEGISVLSSANMPNGQAWDDDEGDDDALTNGEAPSNEFKIVAMPRTNRFGRGGMGGDGDGLNDELDFVGQNEVSKPVNIGVWSLADVSNCLFLILGLEAAAKEDGRQVQTRRALDEPATNQGWPPSTSGPGFQGCIYDP